MAWGFTAKEQVRENHEEEASGLRGAGGSWLNRSTRPGEQTPLGEVEDVPFGPGSKVGAGLSQEVGNAEGNTEAQKTGPAEDRSREPKPSGH